MEGRRRAKGLTGNGLVRSSDGPLNACPAGLESWTSALPVGVCPALNWRSHRDRFVTSAERDRATVRKLSDV